jgi:predicted aminopeptidase
MVPTSAAAEASRAQRVQDSPSESDLVSRFRRALFALAARVALASVGAAGAAALGGCGTMHYVAQAAAGQEDFINRAQPIDALVEGKHLRPRERALLGEIRPIKSFGEQHGLKPTKNYEMYVRLDRRAAVWIVSASEALRFRSKVWRFPIIGSITYVGWFDEKEARAFGADLAKQGWDADVRPAGAYSTLGWFADPVLSTMIPDGPEALGELAEIVLHESLHATFYVNGQSRLNESVANFVGETLARDYLVATRGAGNAPLGAYEAVEAATIRRGKVLYEAHDALEKLYAEKIPDAEKLERKRAIIAAAQKASGITRPINNATLIQYKTYHSGEGELAALYAACGKDMQRFIRAVKRLEATAFAHPQMPDVSAIIAGLQNRCD